MKTFSRTICLSDFVGEATASLPQPPESSSAAWAAVSPLSAPGA